MATTGLMGFVATLSTGFEGPGDTVFPDQVWVAGVMGACSEHGERVRDSVVVGRHDFDSYLHCSLLSNAFPFVKDDAVSSTVAEVYIAVEIKKEGYGRTIKAGILQDRFEDCKRVRRH